MKALYRDTRLKLAHNPTGELIKVIYALFKSIFKQS